MNTRMKILSYMLIITILTTVGSILPVYAATRDTVSFKSRIVDERGNPPQDGNYNFRFLFMNAASGGTVLWSETRTNVPVRRGNFDVDLGAVFPIDRNIFANNADVYLQICFDANQRGGDGSSFCGGSFEEEFRSRKRITATTWALRSFSLGPVSVGEDQTAYTVDTFSQATAANIFDFRINGDSRLSLSNSGDLTVSNGTNVYQLLLSEQKLMLTTESDIYFGQDAIGQARSLKNIASSTTSGASIIGAFPGNFQNVTGDDVQEVLESIDDKFNTGANEIDPVWVSSRDTNTTSITPTWTFKNLLNVGYDGNLVAGQKGLNIDTTSSITPTSGNANTLNLNLKYNPTGTTGSEIFNPVQIISELAAGDASSISRMRGIRTVLTNNIAGTAKIYGYSQSITNNTTAGEVQGISGFGINNGTITGRQPVNMALLFQNNGTIVGEGLDIHTLNNEFDNNASGSIPQYWGIENKFINSGTATGGAVLNFNTFTNTSTINNGVINTYLDTSNTGTVSAVANPLNQGMYSINSRLNFGTVVNGNTHGLNNYIYGTASPDLYAVKNEVTSAELTTSNVTGNAYGTANLFTSGAGSNFNVTGNIYGVYNNIDSNGTITSAYGIYNRVNPTGTVTNNYGLYSTDDTTNVYLNYQKTHAIYSTSGEVYFNGGVRVGGSASTDAGTMRWTGTDFEGYDGGTWLSLTAGAGTGDITAVGSMTINDAFADATADGDWLGLGGTDGRIQFTDALVDEVSVLDGDLIVRRDVDGDIGGRIFLANNNGFSGAGGAVDFTGVDVASGPTARIRSLDDGAASSQLTFWTSPTGGGALTERGRFTSNSEFIVGGEDNTAPLYLNYGALVPTFRLFNGDTEFNTEDIKIGTTASTYTVTLNADDVAINAAILLNITGSTQFNSNVDFLGDLYLNGTSTATFDGLATFNGGAEVVNTNLLVTNGAICADGGTGCPALSPGGIYGDLAYTEYDVAENILATQDVAAGDIVAPLAEAQEVVRKSNSAYETSIIGGSSTDPGSLGGYNLQERDGYKKVPITLAGRVPVKVNLENGPIKAGDPITSSSTPGVGMKAIMVGRIIGFALESFTGGNQLLEGKIVIQLNPSFYITQTDLNKLGKYFDSMVKPLTEGVLQNNTQVSQQAESSNTIIDTKGKAILFKGNTAVIVKNNAVNENSFIILTPTSTTRGQQLYIYQQRQGEFVIKIDKTIDLDINFNYLISN